MKRILEIGLLFFVNYFLTSFNSNAQNKITAYQHWFDNEYGSRKLTMVSPVEHLELDAAISLETITNGLHSFTIRFIDAEGLWSIPTSQYFYTVDLTNNKINSYQYWFDNNYNSNKLVSIPPEEQLQLNALLPLENISEGLHIITLRFKDSKEKWSIPANQFFYKSNSITEENKIIAYRYWLNEDIENTTYVKVSNPIQLLNLNENLDLTGSKNGDYIIHFQFKDISGKWSLVTSDNFMLNTNIAIENTLANSIEVYPNPTSGKMILKLDASNMFSTQSLKYQLYDVNDKMLRNGQLKKIETIIDMTDLAPSAYLLKVTKKNKIVKTFKIIKN